MITGAVCLSHTPLLDRARALAEAEAGFHAAVARAAAHIVEAPPQLAVVFHPDHFNGFFYDLMPPFCIGARAHSIGDFGTVPGALAVAEDQAVDCARACLWSGIDVALSYRMEVDHGCVQPLELLANGAQMPPVVPAFINCVAPPLPSFKRAAAFGAAVGRWAAGIDARVLMIASGGLSHDPPIPSIAGATPMQQAALIDNRDPTHSSRLARQQRVYRARIGETRNGRTTRAINVEWDRDVLDRLVNGDLAFADDWNDDTVTADAGCGAHEVRTWIAALSALKTGVSDYRATLEFYQPIDAWLTGTGVLVASGRQETRRN